MTNSFKMFWLALVSVLLCCAALPANAVYYANTSVPFSWVSPATHTNVTWVASGGCDTGGDDSITAQLNLGFTFNYGGTNYTQVRIMNNGRLQFNNNVFCGAGTQVITPRAYTYPYPDANLTNTMRVYGADLDATLNGSGGGPGPTTCPAATCYVRYATLGAAPNRSFVVTWVNVPDWGATGSYFNLQVILHENGEFDYQYGTSNNTTGGKAQIGWELSTTDYGLVTFTNIGALANTAIRFYPAQLAEYRMEQCSWSGAAGQVVDSSGFNNHGQRIGAAQTTGAGKICQGGNIPSNTSSATIDAIATPFTVNTIGNSGAISFWYKSTNPWNGGSSQDSQLFDANKDNNVWFFLSKLQSNGRLRFVVTDSAGTNRSVETANNTIAANTWTHIAVTWSLAAGANQSVFNIYLNGALAATTTTTTTGVLGSFTTLYFGDNRSANIAGGGISGTGNSANGVLDQIRVYRYPASSTVISADYLFTHACGTSCIDHFAINTGGASGSTCSAKNISITAQDASNATLTGYTGTINLGTSTNHGDWSKVSAGGTLTPGAADSGTASYQFVAGDNGVITLGLLNQHADNLTVSVVDSVVGSTLSTSSTINFLDNAFVITNDTVQIAGRPQAMNAAMWRKDPITGTCAMAAGYTGVKNLKAWLTRDVSDPGGTAPTIGALSLPNALPGANNLALTFAAGSVNFNLGTADVGKYVLNLRDDSRTFVPTADINGSSSTITTSPFALAVSAIRQGAVNNPANNGSGGAVFAKAGTSFQATVGAYLWNGVADVDNNGVPDSGATLAQIMANGAAPNYKWATTLSAIAPFTPSPGVAGTLSNGAIASGSFSSGTATPATLNYSEVGSFTMQAAATNFLNSGINLASYANSVVGRFIPDHFVLTAPSITNRSDLACASSIFTYMAEPFDVGFTLTAQNAATPNATTQNYVGAFAKLGLSTPASFVFGAIDNAVTKTPLTSRLNLQSSSGTWTLGAAGVTARVSLNRAASPDGAFENFDFGTAPLDSDGVQLLPGALDMDADNNAINERAKLFSSKIRYGRLRIDNGHGSERLALQLPIKAQYFDGTVFRINTDDNCTTFSLAGSPTCVGTGPGSTCTLGDFTVTLVKGPLTANAALPVSLTPSSLSSGAMTLLIPAPNASGSVDITINVPAWLQYTWKGIMDNPKARATFGIYNNANEFIYMRETY